MQQYTLIREKTFLRFTEAGSNSYVLMVNSGMVTKTEIHNQISVAEGKVALLLFLS
jgi:hypothetical protein